MEAALLGCGNMDILSAQQMVLSTLSKNKVGSCLCKTFKLYTKFEAVTFINELNLIYRK